MIATRERELIVLLGCRGSRRQMRGAAAPDDETTVMLAAGSHLGDISSTNVWL